MDAWTAIRNSKLYHLVRKGNDYFLNSTLYRILGSNRILGAILFVFVAVSIVRILFSGMSDPVKFLSFAVMFFAIAWLVRDVIRPTEA
jgi:hypothetical protein